jgi:hypothetical protein
MKLLPDIQQLAKAMEDSLAALAEAQRTGTNPDIREQAGLLLKKLQKERGPLFVEYQKVNSHFEQHFDQMKQAAARLQQETVELKKRIEALKAERQKPRPPEPEPEKPRVVIDSGLSAVLRRELLGLLDGETKKHAAPAPDYGSLWRDDGPDFGEDVAPAPPPKPAAKAPVKPRKKPSPPISAPPPKGGKGDFGTLLPE